MWKELAMDLLFYFTEPSTRIPASLAVFFTTLLSAKIIHSFIKDNSPPGPMGVPLLGYLPFFGTEPYVTFMKLREKYGDIFSIKMGSFPAVVLNGKDLIKEALVTRGDDFSGRPEFYSNILLGSDTLTFGKFSNASIAHRHLASNSLYVFGNARKNPIEEIVNYESKLLVAELIKLEGKPFYPKPRVNVAVGSIVFQISYGKHVNLRDDDKDFVDFFNNANDFISFVSAGNPVDIIPWLRFVMPWKAKKFVNIVKESEVIRDKKLAENLETYTPGVTRHLCDGLIAANKEEQAKDEPFLSEKRIYSTLGDLIGAGFETVANTMTWSILLLTAHPEIQTKVHREIDEIIGKRQPMLADKAEMNYCNAVISEVFRFGNIVPLAIPHAATKDTELNGFTIHQGTIVIPNMYSISHDPEIWGDPDTFRPERYLDSDGKFDETVAFRFNPFSMGRRKCIGEFLARAEAFLFFVGILQYTKFKKPESVKEYSMEADMGLTRSAKPFEVCCSMRD